MVDRVAADGPLPAGVLKPALALVLNAAVWGTSWWPFRQLQDHGLHPLWSTTWAYLFSLACLLALRPASLRPVLREPGLWLLALVAGVTNVGFNWGVTVGDVVRVVLLFYLMPAWTVLLAWALLGERPTAAALMRLLLALAGVLVVLGAGRPGWPVPRSLADWLGVVGGFSFAFTNIQLRRLHAVPASARVMAMFLGGAILAALAGVLAMALGLATAPSLPGPPAWGYGLGLGLALLAGNMALQYGASRLPAHTTALVMLSEVVFASVSSMLLGAAEPRLHTWAGGALILVAAAWSAASDRAGAQA